MASIISHWAGRPLAIRPESLAALIEADALAPGASRFPGERTRDGVARVTKNGTGVMTIDGPLMNRGVIIGENRGFSTYEGLAFKLGQMARDPKIKCIVLDVNSPGGEAAGAFELAALIRKVNSEKPVYSCINGMAASAADALARGARAIVGASSAMSGSIGVVLIHADFSRPLDEAGITPTLIHAGAHKVDGNPYAPLSKEVRGDLQKEIDQF